VLVDGSEGALGKSGCRRAELPFLEGAQGQPSVARQLLDRIESSLATEGFEAALKKVVIVIDHYILQ
jgi:hypothetical protein